VTLRTQSWAQRRHGGTTGRRTRRSGPTAARTCSDEQSREEQGNKWRNKGMGDCSPQGETIEHRGNDGDALPDFGINVTSEL
jgi:hypothetical protein